MVKGILLQKKGPAGVVMTPDGRFVRVLLIKNQRTLGQEVAGTELRFPSLLQGVAVASILILVCVIGLWAKMMPGSAAAYVALDINPSLELAIDNEGKVINAEGLDGEGRELLKKVDPKNLVVYQAVELLVAGASRYNYLNDTNNVVLATVTPTKQNQKVVDEEKLEAAVNDTVAGLATPVKVVTERATVQEHKQASKQGVSVGRYLIHQGSTKQGAQISIEEVKKKGLGQLEKEKGIEIQLLLPHPKLRVNEIQPTKMEPEKDLESPDAGKPGQLLPAKPGFEAGKPTEPLKQIPPGLIIKEQIHQRLQNSKPMQNKDDPGQRKQEDKEYDEDEDEEEEDNKDHEKDDDEDEERRDDRRQKPLGPPPHLKDSGESVLEKLQERQGHHREEEHPPGKPGQGPKGTEKED
ncbi:MAG: anti-sigma-I factor RsgI family protein [Bacillota bacterium]|nr:hypothetical protein [Bacillota bacterium]